MRTLLLIALDGVLWLGKLAIKAAVKRTSPEFRAALPPVVEQIERVTKKTTNTVDDRAVGFIKDAIGLKKAEGSG
jgi:hypothetical protein